MNFIKSVAQGQAASRNIATGQNFVLITSQLKIKLIPEKKYGDSKADYLQSPIFETCVIGGGA